MAFRFPFSTLHELNLDWILEKVKTFAELIPPMETAVEDVQSLSTDVQQAVEDAQQALEDAGTALETAEEAKEIAEQAAQGTIADGAVTTAKIADDAVTTAKIADGAVTGAKIAANTIQSGNLSSGCVTTTQILDGTISPDDLGAECVTTSKLGAAAVTTAKIDDGAVTSAKIANGTIQLIDLDAAIADLLITDSEDFPIDLDGSTSSLSAIRCGGIVQIGGSISKSGGFSGNLAGTIIGQVPVNFRPRESSSFYTYARTSNSWGAATFYPVRVGVGSDGNVSIWMNNSSFSSCVALQIIGYYLI